MNKKLTKSALAGLVLAATVAFSAGCAGTASSCCDDTKSSDTKSAQRASCKSSCKGKAACKSVM